LAVLPASILPALAIGTIAVQWLACEFPPYSRAAATAGSGSVYVAAALRRCPPDIERHGALDPPLHIQTLWSSVFPCTKSAMIVEGQLRPLWITQIRGKFPRREET